MSLANDSSKIENLTNTVKDIFRKNFLIFNKNLTSFLTINSTDNQVKLVNLESKLKIEIMLMKPAFMANTSTTFVLKKLCFFQWNITTTISEKTLDNFPLKNIKTLYSLICLISFLKEPIFPPLGTLMMQVRVAKIAVSYNVDR
jgi:hypothetical protein